MTLSNQQSKFAKLVQDKFLTNRYSAAETIELARYAQEDGAKYKCDKNASRNMLRACLKDCNAPELYFSGVRVKDANVVGGGSRVAQVAFMLAHELLPCMVGKGNVQEDGTCAIGLHGDGAPFAAKMKDSIEQFSWSFCGDASSPRFLFCALPKSCCWGRETYEDILEVFAKPMHVFAAGVHPSCRLDGQPFRPGEDDHRRDIAGTSVGVNARLMELRGDWTWYAQVFGFPSWNSTRMCWKCCASQLGFLSFRNTDKEAGWRRRRLDSESFLRQQKEAGVQPSVIFTAPGCKVEFVKIDWLRTADLGMTQVILGNSLWEALAFLPGNTQAEKVSNLWFRIKAWYKKTKPSTQFQGLTLEMLKLPGKGPRLRGKAAETRHLVPFALELAREFRGQSYHANLVYEVLEHLASIYTFLDMQPFPATSAAQECNDLCVKFVALSLEAEQLGRVNHWAIKPKLHLLQELLEHDCVETGQSPRSFWTYVDESWGGIVANLAGRRGGPKSAEGVNRQVMTRYRIFLKE